MANSAQKGKPWQRRANVFIVLVLDAEARTRIQTSDGRRPSTIPIKEEFY